jgi:hypothetical protein
MASVYLNTVAESRPLALDGAFEFTRAPGIGDIIQVIDKSSPTEESVWFQVLNVVHHDRKRDHTDVDAELFGNVMSV